MRNIFWIISVFIFSAGAQAQTMSMVDLLNVPTLRDGQLSPDGRSVLFVKSQASWEHNRNISTIWRASIDSEKIQQMTAGPANTLNPRWSPDEHAVIPQRKNWR